MRPSPLRNGLARLRLPLLALLLALPLSGCTAPEAPPPDSLLVRVFVDDVDADGRDEAVVRLAAWTHPSTVEPFTGTVEVTLRTMDRITIPRYHHSVVGLLDFHTDDELPYYEVVFPASHLRPHERIEAVATAELVDGSRVAGAYEAFV